MIRLFSDLYETISGASRRKTMIVRIAGLTTAIVGGTCVTVWALCRIYKKYISDDVRRATMPFREDFDACFADDNVAEDGLPAETIECEIPPQKPVVSASFNEDFDACFADDEEEDEEQEETGSTADDGASNIAADVEKTAAETAEKRRSDDEFDCVRDY